MVLRILLSGRRPLRLTSWGFKCQMPQQSLLNGGVQFPLRVSSIERLPYDNFGIREQKEGPSFRKRLHTIIQRPATRLQKTCKLEPPWLLIHYSGRFQPDTGVTPITIQTFIWMIKTKI